MNLTPRQIQEMQFHDAFRGYSHEEVDRFLDAVAEAFDHVFRENQTLHHRLKEMEVKLTQATGSEDMLKRMLVTAQETADKAVQEARTKGQSIEEQATSHSQSVISEAEKKAQQIVVAALAKERELQDGIEGAKRFDREYRARLRAFIESQLRLLDEGPVPVPAESPSQTPPAKASPPAVPFERAETPAAPRPVEPAAPDARSVVTEVMRRTDAGRLTNGTPPTATPPTATPPTATPPTATPPTATPREAVIRLPQEAPALVAPAVELDPGKEEGRSIDELFWGEE